MAKAGTIYVNKPAEESHQEKAKEELKKLDKLAEESGEIIFEISAVFPFQLFPDKIIIDGHKVTIVRKEIFFAAIEFEIKGYEINPRPISFLWPDQATKAKQYILGLMSAERGGVDLTEVPTEKVRGKLKKIGKAKDEVESLF